MSLSARIVGYGGRNVGDRAYREVFARLLPCFDLAFSNHCKPEHNPDLLILGGGDVVLRPYTSTFSDEEVRRTLVASVSITPGSDFDFLAKCRRVIVRDRASQALCLEQGMRVEHLPDLAFALEADPERGREWIEEMFDREGLDRYNKLVCVVPNSYMWFGGHESPSRDFTKALSVADDLAYVLDRTPSSFIFLPFSTQAPVDDRVSSGYINSRTKYHSKNLVVYDRLDVQMTLDVMSACDAVIGGRLHSLIFSVIAGRPFIAMDHHRKITDFVDEIQRPHWSFRFNDMSRENVLQLLREHLEVGHDDDFVAYANNARSAILSSELC